MVKYWRTDYLLVRVILGYIWKCPKTSWWWEVGGVGNTNNHYHSSLSWVESNWVELRVDQQLWILGFQATKVPPSPIPITIKTPVDSEIPVDTSNQSQGHRGLEGCMGEFLAMCMCKNKKDANDCLWLKWPDMLMTRYIYSTVWTEFSEARFSPDRFDQFYNFELVNKKEQS